MVEATKLEDIAKTAPQQEKKEVVEKQPSALEEIADAGKNISAIAAEIAFPFMFSGENRTNAMINAYPLSVGARIDDKMAGKPIDLKSNIKAAKESFVGTITAPLFAELFKGIELVRQTVTNYAGALPGGAAAVGALAAAQSLFVGGYMGFNHIVQNFSFKGLYQKFKKDYWPALKRTWMYVLPLSALNVLYIPTTALYKAYGVAVQLAYGSLITLLFRLVGLKTEGAKLSNLVKAMNPIPYIGATLSTTGKFVRNTFKGLYDTGYVIGRIGAPKQAMLPA